MSTSASSEMLYDVMAASPRKMLFQQIPELLDMGFSAVQEEGFPPEIDKYSFTIYTVLLYSPDTHLDMQAGPLLDRKKRAAKIAGFKDNNGEWDNTIISLLFGLQDQSIRKIIHTYMRLHPVSSDSWRTLVFYEELIFQIEAEVFHPMAGASKKPTTEVKDRVALMEKREELLEKKNRAMQTFYKGHDDIAQLVHHSALLDTMEDWARENVVY